MIRETEDGGLELTDPENDCVILEEIRNDMMERLRYVENHESVCDLRKKVQIWKVISFAEAMLLIIWILQVIL